MSEPHTMSKGGMPLAEAEKCIRLLGQSTATAQADLNRIAITYRLTDATADAATVNRRVRQMVEGIMQAHAAGRYPA